MNTCHDHPVITAIAIAIVAVVFIVMAACVIIEFMKSDRLR